MAGGANAELTNTPPPAPRADVDVCVCTFRRPALADTLRGLAAQNLDGLSMRVVVADNDTTPSARTLAEGVARETGLRLCYVHAPEQNISVARNACLDAVDAPLAAFVDDDEVPAADWLASLVRRQRSTDADVVLGRVNAVYAADAPEWMRRQDLHSTRAVVRCDGTIDTGYTCNVLFRTTVLHGRRFDPALGRTGGEDTLFFHALHAAGARIVEAPEAVVAEAVPPARARMGWLVARAFRSGQTHALMLRAQGLARPRILALAVAKAGWCAAAALGKAVALQPDWRRLVVRGALHAGVVARSLGRRELQLY